jgi:hypothetical protein
MAGISNIIGSYNINHKRVSSKLSFEIGQVFAAKIIAASELKGELILKLLDGWQFPAKLQNPLDFIPEGLVRFEVEGFKDGKLQLKIVKDKKEQEEIKKSSIEDLVQKGNIDIDKEDYETLKKMIRHNMPLTKENIANVKTILDFKDKITADSQEEEKFIAKYLKSKGIDVESTKGREIIKTLKDFFSELKSISSDEVLTMLQNDIELSEENIRSFKKLSKDRGVIYKELKDLSSAMDVKSSIEESFNPKELVKRENNNLEAHGQNIRGSSDSKAGAGAFTIAGIIEQDINSIQGLSTKDIESMENLKKLMDGTQDEVSNISTKPSKDQKSESIPNPLEEQENPKAIEKNLKDVLKLDKNTLENVVKEQLTSKAEEMKSIIKTFMDEGNSTDDYTKVLNNIKEYVNDFKVFNSLSNQYYYMDVPLNVNRDEYQCKLLIKDDRKSGKKIDSKNVSLVVSVKTTAIGMVDAYIKVREQSMSVDIKCEDTWTKLLSVGKDSLIKELSENGYNVFINVSKREKEATLSNCSDFFDDSNLGTINARA